MSLTNYTIIGIWHFQCTSRLETLHRASFMFIQVILDIQSHIDSVQESGMSSKCTWRTLWRRSGQCPLPIYRGARNFAQSFLIVYIYHSFCPYSSWLDSGIKNVLQDSLKEALETLWSISSSSAARGLKFCRDLPLYLYFPFLTSIGLKPCLRNQECPPKLLGGNFED